MADESLLDRWIKQAKDRRSIAVLCFVGIVVIAIASFTDALGRLSSHLFAPNSYSVTIQHDVGQPGRLSEHLGSAVVTSRWAAVISNIGDKTDSLVKVTITAHHEDEDVKYLGFDAGRAGNVYNAAGEVTQLPITLEAGRSTKVFIELSVAMDRAAFELLSDAYPGNKISSLAEANKLVAQTLGTDMFGQKAESMGVDKDTPLGFGVAVWTDRRNPVVAIDFETARNARFSGSADWYQGEAAHSLKPGERPRSRNK